ncbi:TIGR01621 family pseudouridine synthase [Lentisphaera profundi]|uniref:TIGR01621 family pseudouridine synthase n=1 Tax=Lentisphaera profundi TaxID=1658616 RepID=A0ABY7VW32_9BACT|nr:TIGR01621 family pseudouridine synthase [Lentisphaera profundi]WDE97469.1 TIGR01621 family pseudouridine synthase [Lentisphaera profundi]
MKSDPEIVFDHEDFMVVHKRAGDNFHSDDGELGFFHKLKQQHGEIYPVHRLDKVTSGLLIVAKNIESCREINELFKSKKIEKYYLAISDRKPKKKQGWIIGDMERSRRATWKLCESRKNPAVTQFFSKSIGTGQRIFLLKPQTGKTHQLRVAMKAIGSPISGDPLYCPKSQEVEERCYLHAYAMNFNFRGEDIHIIKKPSLVGRFSSKVFLEVLEESYLKPWELVWPKRK